jgi:hypothetical protein
LLAGWREVLRGVAGWCGVGAAVGLRVVSW